MKIKKTGSFEGEPNKLGGGGRFKQMVASGKSPALAAFIGRKMYGKKKMSKMAAGVPLQLFLSSRIYLNFYLYHAVVCVQSIYPLIYPKTPLDIPTYCLTA